MKKILVIIIAVIGLIAVGQVKGQQACITSKDFAEYYGKLVAAKEKIHAPEEYESCSPAVLKQQAVLGKLLNECLVKATTPDELSMIVTAQYWDEFSIPYSCYKDTTGVSTSLAQIYLNREKFPKLLTAHKIWQGMLNFASTQFQLKLVADSTYDYEMMLVTKRPLAEYAPYQIVLLFDIVDENADDQYWTQEDLVAAVQKLRATGCEYYISKAEELEVYIDTPADAD